MWTASEQEKHFPGPSKIPSVLFVSPIGFTKVEIGGGKSDPYWELRAHSMNQ
jgi:hypothetical protein